MKKNLFFAGLAAVVLMFAGCGGDKKVEERVGEIQTNNTNAIASTTTAAQEIAKTMTVAPMEGKQIFATRCVACHGEKGEGKGSYPKLIGNTKDQALTKLKGYVYGTYGNSQIVAASQFGDFTNTSE